MTYEEAAEEILEKFPFEGVEEHMLSVKWKWGAGDRASIPSLFELKKCARDLIFGVKGDSLGVATGGFEVRLIAKRNSCAVGLGFGRYHYDEDEAEKLFWVEAPYTPA